VLKFAWIFGKFKHDSLLLHLNLPNFCAAKSQAQAKTILIYGYELKFETKTIAILKDEK